MALKFLDSFDVHTDEWAGTPTVSFAAGRTGNAMSFNVANTVTPKYRFVPGGFDAGVDYYLGAALRFTSAYGNGTSSDKACAFGLGNGASFTGYGIWVAGADRRLHARRMTTTTGQVYSTDKVITYGSWHYIEMKIRISSSVGVFQAWLDGVQVFAADLTGLNTLDGAGAITSIVLGGGGALLEVDDLYVCDTSGAANNNRLGNLTVNAIRPTSDGFHTAFTPSTGGTGFALVDETPFANTDYNTGVTGSKETYGFGDVNATRVVRGLQVSTQVSTETGGGSQGRPIIRIGSTDYPLATEAVGSGSSRKHIPVDVSPATAAAWTGAEVKAAEFGYEVL
jgi:hypothetical protein